MSARRPTLLRAGTTPLISPTAEPRRSAAILRSALSRLYGAASGGSFPTRLSYARPCPFMPSEVRVKSSARWSSGMALAANLIVVAGCARDQAACARCGTVVIAATGEPSQLLPPLVVETVGRDIGDQVYERLADLAPGGAPIDTTAYRPALADRWERVDSLTWRFHLRPGRALAGRPPGDRGGRAVLVRGVHRFRDRRRPRGRISSTGSPSPPRTRPRSSSGSRSRSPEQLYDATYHVRIIPSHIWAATPAARWAADTSVAHLVGSGPYRVAEWKRGEYVRLAADSSTGARPSIRQAIWRFASDPDAALNLVLSHEADLLETLVGQTRRGAVERDSDAPARALRVGHVRLPRLPDRRADRRPRRVRSSPTPPPAARWRWRSIGRRSRARCSGARPRRRRDRCRSCSGSGTTASPRCRSIPPPPGGRSTRPVGAGASPERPGSVRAARWRSTSWCRSRARSGGSSRSRCRRCGRRSARR